MASRDILVLNTTASRAETQQGSDTVVVRGDSTNALSIENSSGTSVLSVDTISSSIDVTGDITASGNFSSSLASSASFGRLEAVSLKGDAFNLTDTDLPNTISSSGQIAAEISGAFRRGFEFTGTIGDFSPDNENMITASFGRIVATSLSGSAANLTNTDITNTISGAAQIADNISGSFQRGFEFTGTISGSATSTGSFGQINAITITGDVRNMSNVTKAGMISSSGQIASEISASFQGGFEFDGSISGSATSTGSFSKYIATKAVGNISAMENIFPRGSISGSAQIASRISGAFEDGFEFTGKISASAGNTNTGSFSQVVATKITGDVSGMTGTGKPGFVSGSGQLATSISGSFGKGFTFGFFAGNPSPFAYTPSVHRNFRGCIGAFSAGGALIVAKRNTAGIGTKAGALVVAGDTNPDPAAAHLDSTEEYNGTSFSEVNNLNTARKNIMGAGTTEAGIVAGGSKFPSNGTIACTEVYNGTNWSEEADMNYCTKASGDAGDSSEAAIVFGGNFNTPVSHYTQQSEEYNGTTWSEITSLITGRSDLAGLGNSESALAVAGEPTPGGHTPGNSFATEEWNGSNWSTVADTLRNPFLNNYVKGAGTVNDGHAFGGCFRCYNPSTGYSYHYDGKSQHYDGTAWAHGDGLIDGRRFGGGDGTSGDNGFYVGGGVGPAAPSTSTCMEVYSRTFITASFGKLETHLLEGNISNMTNINPSGIISSSGQIASQISGSFNKGFTFSGDITSKAVVFSSGGDLNCTEDDNRSTYRGAAGNKNAGLIYGGYRFGYGPAFAEHGCTEEYDGTTWTEKNDMITDGATSGGGTTEAAIATGGFSRAGCTEYWNGSNWSECNDQIFNTTTNINFKTLSIGQSSDAIIISGFNQASPYGQTEEWNGTNWATANQMNHDPRVWHGGAGTANAGLTAGGPYGPSSQVSCTEEWNGTNWSEGPSALISNMKAVSMAGSQNDTLLAGFVQATTFQSNNLLNNPNTNSADTICWNGINWSTSATLGVRRMGMSAAGESTGVAFFASGLENASPHKAECTIEVETFVASASFGHIEAIRITGSVDGMINIDPPVGAVSGSAQIASSISGSFNKGFEFNGEVRSLGVWSDGATFPGFIGKYGSSAIGIRDAAIVAGAFGSYSPWCTQTYLYNGLTWSETGHAMIQGGTHSSHGTANAGLAIGRYSRAPGDGYAYAYTEEYNGSAWSETTDLPHKLTCTGNQSAGTQNAALTAGGNCDAGNDLDAIKYHALAWDGLSYAHVGDLAEARDNAALAGTQNSALAQGGGSNSSYAKGSHSTCTEEWNGNAWSVAAASNFPAGNVAMAAGKSSNDAMHVYDVGSSTQTSDFYNGISWNLGPRMNNLSTYQNGGATGTTGKSFFMAPYNPGGGSAVEHFDENHVTSSIGRVDANELTLESDTDLVVNNSFQLPIFAANPEVTSSAGEVWYNRAEEKLYFTYDINSWSEVADTNTSHNFGGYAGGTGEGIIWAGGASPANIANSEVWDGNTWSEVNDLNQAGIYAPGGGSSNAAIAAGRNNPGFSNITETWDGTSWTEVNDGAIGYGASFAGTVNAGFQAGCRHPGDSQPKVDTVEWNGTNWSAGGDLITAKADQAAMAGTQNAAKHMGGGGGAFAAPHYITDLVEDYNGTSFSTAVSLPYCVMRTSGGGTQNAAILAGGYSNTDTTSDQTYEWDGTSFHQTANMGTGRCTNDVGGGSQSSFQVSSGGTINGSETKTEQYTTTGIGCHCIGGV